MLAHSILIRKILSSIPISPSRVFHSLSVCWVALNCEIILMCLLQPVPYRELPKLHLGVFVVKFKTSSRVRHNLKKIQNFCFTFVWRTEVFQITPRHVHPSAVFGCSEVGSCHKRQPPQAPTPQAPIRNRETKKVANAKLHNCYANLS